MSGPGPSKKQRCYSFQTEWEEDFCFVENKGNGVCLLCNSSVTVKKYNIERHFETNHAASFNKNYLKGSELRKRKVRDLKAKLSSQQSLFTKPQEKAENITIASFKIAYVLAKKKKPFTDGDMLKEAFISAADVLFDGFPNRKDIISAISNLQLSARTVTRRVQDISKDLKRQINDDINKCIWYALQMDESLDVEGTAQLAVIIRMVFEDYSAKEEFLGIIPLKERTKGEDIFEAFKRFVVSCDLPLAKLSSITTDGAPAMIGTKNGFLALCRNDDSFPPFTNYHCIIHQEVLCGKMAAFKHVIEPVTKMVNFIRSAPLQHRLFKKLLEEEEAEYCDLIMYTEIRWLSKGKVLERFISLIDEVKVFLECKTDLAGLFSDHRWLVDLGFITDIMLKLNELNLELQGSHKHVADMISSVNAFKNKLDLWKSHLLKNSLSHFPNMKRFVKDNKFDVGVYIGHLEVLQISFSERFEQFQELQSAMMFFINPFVNSDLTEVTRSVCKILHTANETDLEIEILELQSNLSLKVHFTDASFMFWKLVDSTKFPLLKNAAFKAKSHFGSTYLCESLFTNMNFLK